MFTIEFVLGTVLFISLYNPCRSEDEKELQMKRFEEALSIAATTSNDFFTMFQYCVHSSMSNQQFSQDNLQSFINYPSKTTVGFAPRFTANRKFFANMIMTPAFKEMLAKDEEEVRKNMVRKMKYCDEAIMDQDLLKDFYDREVDQTKI